MKLIRCVVCLLLYDIHVHACCPQCAKEIAK